MEDGRKILIVSVLVLFASLIVIAIFLTDMSVEKNQYFLFTSMFLYACALFVWDSTEKSQEIIEKRKKSNYEKLRERDPMKAFL